MPPAPPPSAPAVPTVPNARPATDADLAGLVALQHAAYGPMALVSGAQPLPLRVDYREIMATSEIWLVDGASALDAALILQHEGEVTLIWSVAVHPETQSRGLGQALLKLADDRARARGARQMRLYTNKKFERNRAIYRRYGYAEVREELYGDAEPPWMVVHMEKPL